MSNPYTALPSRSFWRPAVAERHPLDINELWQPKFPINQVDRLITAGSCFAQHIGHALSARGYTWVGAEPAPGFVSPDLASKYNYGIFSFWTGNIYTTRLLKQWLQWAAGEQSPPSDAWESKGRWFDPFRPLIEPDGYDSEEELLVARSVTLAAIRSAISSSSVFVFTLGLTEAWLDARNGLAYPLCPGTAKGSFDARHHVFANFDYNAVHTDLREACAVARRMNPDIRFLLTVSPVPLTATATGGHVLTATTYSKSVLRAVAGSLALEPGVDYFPSYEIVTSTPFRGMFYEQNARSVSKHGVGFVMDSFFRCLGATDSANGRPGSAEVVAVESDGSGDVDEKCEEALLSAFVPGSSS